MSANPKHRWTVEEYLAFERTSEVKHEFIDGEVFDMCGTRVDYPPVIPSDIPVIEMPARHNQIAANALASLHTALLEHPCIVYASDQRVRVRRQVVTYADISIVCGVQQLEDNDTLLNPTVIVEVLSPSTENYDRGKKFEAYRRLESLREYVLIAQDRPYIERYVRGDDGSSWTLTDARGLDAEMPLMAVPALLRLADVYRRVTFESTDSSIDL